MWKNNRPICYKDGSGFKTEFKFSCLTASVPNIIAVSLAEIIDKEQSYDNKKKIYVFTYSKNNRSSR